MKFRNFLQRSNGSAVLNCYSQSANGEQLQKVESSPVGAQKLPNAIRIVRENTSDTRPEKTVVAFQSRSEMVPQQNEQERQQVKVGHDQIAARAFEIWVEEGRPEGRAEIHWLRAERELQG